MKIASVTITTHVGTDIGRRDPSRKVCRLKTAMMYQKNLVAACRVKHGDNKACVNANHPSPENLPEGGGADRTRTPKPQTCQNSRLFFYYVMLVILQEDRKVNCIIDTLLSINADVIEYCFGAGGGAEGGGGGGAGDGGGGAGDGGGGASDGGGKIVIEYGFGAGGGAGDGDGGGGASDGGGKIVMS
eukprot:scaffold72587_cov48-Attheya_sp.AAC.2